MPDKKSTLSAAKEDFQEYVRKSVEGARALRDELTQKAEHGTEDAKAAWAELEHYLSHLDAVAHDLNHAAGAFGEKLLSLVRSAAPKRAAKKVAQKAAKKAPKAVKKAAQKATKQVAKGGKAVAKRGAKKGASAKRARR